VEDVINDDDDDDDDDDDNDGDRLILVNGRK